MGYPAQTPTFADCMWVDGWSRFLIDRHDMAINVLFADGHAKLVPLGDLWLLRWSRLHEPVAMQVP